MFQALLLQFVHGGVLRHLLQPLRAVHGADVYLQHLPGEYLLLLDEHSGGEHDRGPGCAGGGGGGGDVSKPQLLCAPGKAKRASG